MPAWMACPSRGIWRWCACGELQRASLVVDAPTPAWARTRRSTPHENCPMTWARTVGHDWSGCRGDQRRGLGRETGSTAIAPARHGSWGARKGGRGAIESEDVHACRRAGVEACYGVCSLPRFRLDGAGKRMQCPMTRPLGLDAYQRSALSCACGVRARSPSVRARFTGTVRPPDTPGNPRGKNTA